MLSMIQDLIDKKIEEAIKKGEFENLPGTGKPLDLNEDPFVPEELRTTYRILKNSGFRPAEVEMKIELENLKQEYLLKTDLTESEKDSYQKKITQLETAYALGVEKMKYKK